jgi:hypothetical protein
MLRLLSALTAFSQHQVPFEATFHDVQLVGSSNYTHFWMPAPLTRASAAGEGQLGLSKSLYLCHCLFPFLQKGGQRKEDEGVLS